MLNETLRSRWLSGCLNGGLWLLLLFAVLGIGGRQPQFREAEADPSAVITPVPVARLENLFAPTNWPKLVMDPASQSAFATTHFIPPVVPAPPPPAPPTTRKVEITYQGYYETAGGPRRVMLRLGDLLNSIPVGTSVTTNLWVADAVFQTLTLTNSANQTTVLTLNVKKEVEVPLK